MERNKKFLIIQEIISNAQIKEFLCFKIFILLQLSKNKKRGNAKTITITGLIVNKKIEIIEILKKFSKSL